MTEFKASKLENLVKFPQKIAKLVNLYAGDGDYSRRMFGEQFAYGHREILLKYCGLDFSTQIIGNLQHGVYGYKQKIDFRSPRFIGGKPSTFWVYSKMYEEIGKSLGHDNVTAIGAPWLYLRKSISEEMKSISRYTLSKKCRKSPLAMRFAAQMRAMSGFYTDKFFIY